MTNALSEIIRDIPPDVAARHGRGATPVFIAHGCVLLEHFTGKSYAYKAVNINNGRSEQITRRVKPLTESGFEAAALKIRASGIAGPGHFTVDRPPGQNLPHDRLAEIQRLIFEDILPLYGYGVREKQAELAGHMLEVISRRDVSLSEAEVGTGKTHAYLIAAALAKRGRVNDFWLRGHYPGQSYADSAHMPVVVATSSIALQKAIVTDYIPEISRIMMERGIIQTPLTAVIRKGKEHYVCEKNLRSFLYFERDAGLKKKLEALLENRAAIDLGDVEGLKPYIKRKLGVSGRCGDDCPCYEGCRYLRHMKRAQSGEYDFQICNHNYFLADVLHRAKGQKPLIPHYQAVVIDEAHKFLPAARQMYGVELDAEAFPRFRDDLCSFTFKHYESPTPARRLAIKLEKQGKRLFRLLNEHIPQTEYDDEAERFNTVLDEQASRHLRNIRQIIDDLEAMLSEKPVLDRYRGKCSQVLWEMAKIREQATALEKHSDLVYWLEKNRPGDEQATRLCAIPKKLNEMLHRDIWSNRVPIILTSGTLSAGGRSPSDSSFEHIKRITGLHLLSPNRLHETSKPSPFNHSENALLYISETTPFPAGYQDARYVDAVADETARLIRASHGHAAVLFTSYKVMDMVFEKLAKRGLGFRLFRLDRGGVSAIDRFRESGNGVLFASGAMWEGIDLPGDILSLLVIVKLPFAVPDPISEYERTLYGDMDEYKRKVVMPEMLVKLRQGFGRLIRSLTDTGVVAILDSRVRVGGPYRERVLRALPGCPVTDDIKVVKIFFRRKKPPVYFE